MDSLYRNELIEFRAEKATRHHEFNNDEIGGYILLEDPDPVWSV
jgi:hypothetical protein